MSAQTINVHEASLKTATVEIQALVVSGKQVTLAVFRQLKQEPLFHPVKLGRRGVPWGTVNYCDRACAKNPGTHLHVVWELDGELRRCRVNRPSTSDGPPIAPADFEFRMMQYDALTELPQLFIAV